MSPRAKRTSERVPPGTYERLVAWRGREVCWICGAAPKTRRLHIDHDHKTDKVRGLLCHSCNRRLWPGCTEAWLALASQYLYWARRADLDIEPPSA